MLELKDVRISQNGQSILAINHTIDMGEVLSVMGRSGSGKSTLLNWIVGQLPNTFTATGSLILNGVEIEQLPTEHRNIGLMFQDALLFPHMTISENIRFAMKDNKVNHREKILHYLDKVGLKGLENRMPNTLSGGQQSRVALVRLLASDPKAVLLDEPFSNLDTESKMTTRHFVLEQLRITNIPVILVTHDKADADAAKGKIISLDNQC